MDRSSRDVFGIQRVYKQCCNIGFILKVWLQSRFFNDRKNIDFILPFLNNELLLTK